MLARLLSLAKMVKNVNKPVLVVVAGLPFALTYYLIDRSLDSIIDQTQMTHVFVARSNADAVGAYLELVEGSLAAAADNPDLYLEPSSDKALAVMEAVASAATAKTADNFFMFTILTDATGPDQGPPHCILSALSLCQASRILGVTIFLA